MSFRLLASIIDVGDMQPGEKLVLLVLAEAADKHGWCWLSVATILRRTCQGESTVQRALKALETAGHLTRYFRTGTSTKYHLHPRQNETPLPRHHDTPVKSGGVSNRRSTPVTMTPKPVRTCIRDSTDALSLSARAESDEKVADEKLVSAKPKRPAKARPERGLPWHGIPDWIPLDAWHAFLVHRRDNKKKPVTENAARGIIAKLETFRTESGNDPAAVLRQTITEDWIGVFELKHPSPPRSNGHGNRTGSASPDQPTNAFVRASLERAAEHAADGERELD